LRKAGDGKETESEVSDTVTLTPKDVFPPAVPTGLHAIIGTRTVELSWDRDVEPDLAGYHLYRAEGDGQLTQVPAKLVAPSYSDHEVHAGGHYRYAVSAYDLTGNESARSAIIEALVP
jgi:fibronectin type 3 domain-containing protein